jgi:DNA (cytosine-5)-methyltransferase 1
MGGTGVDLDDAEAGHVVYRLQAFGKYAEDETSSTIQSRDYKYVTDVVTKKDDQATLPASDVVVRRLTERECERLQGFPDDWTKVPGNRKSHRYRQMGNAVCVPVAEWILRRIREEEERE